MSVSFLCTFLLGPVTESLQSSSTPETTTDASKLLTTLSVRDVIATNAQIVDFTRTNTQHQESFLTSTAKYNVQSTKLPLIVKTKAANRINPETHPTTDPSNFEPHLNHTSVFTTIFPLAGIFRFVISENM